MRLLLLQGHTIPALLRLIMLTSLGCNGQLADGSAAPSKGPPDGAAGAGPGQEACTKDVGPTVQRHSRA